jgi:hypothetical protein
MNYFDRNGCLRIPRYTSTMPSQTKVPNPSRKGAALPSSTNTTESTTKKRGRLPKDKMKEPSAKPTTKRSRGRPKGSLGSKKRERTLQDEDESANPPKRRRVKKPSRRGSVDLDSAPRDTAEDDVDEEEPGIENSDCEGHASDSEDDADVSS